MHATLLAEALAVELLRVQGQNSGFEPTLKALGT